jgi:hypothetical protein
LVFPRPGADYVAPGKNTKNGHKKLFELLLSILAPSEPQIASNYTKGSVTMADIRADVRQGPPADKVIFPSGHDGPLVEVHRTTSGHPRDRECFHSSGNAFLGMYIY